MQTYSTLIAEKKLAMRIGLVAVSALTVFVGAQAVADEVDFAREIRPILAANCFDCHGPDPADRKANLRLDVNDGLTEPRNGRRILVPGKPDESELFRRIASSDPDYRMPPPSSGKTLTDAQIARIKQWIEEGAKWEQHWSFRPVRAPRVPLPHRIAWCRNPIDAFVLARLEREKLTPSPRADRYTLVRRLYLDLLGIPPTPEEADRFVADPRPDAVERLVDRLLNSVAFGERWARIWLDLARYADTQGYEKDNRRTIWRYRDWLIEAINADMSYDQFTIEQLAGDLLPNPTMDQLIATAFHRNTMTNTEGGTDDEEFRVEAVADRVQTTMQVWMGLTFQCARCHNHKYDPITQEEYYKVFAFFNNTADHDRPDEYPTIPTPTRLQQWEKARLENEIAALERELSRRTEDRVAAFETWLRAATPRAQNAQFDHWLIAGPIADLKVDKLQQPPLPEATGQSDRLVIGEREYAWKETAEPEIGSSPGVYLVVRTFRVEKPERVALKVSSAGAIRVWLDDRLVAPKDAKADGVETILDVSPGRHRVVIACQREKGKFDFAARIELENVPDEAAQLLRQSSGEADRTIRDQLWSVWTRFAPELAPLREKIARLRKKLAAIRPPTTPILQELPPEKRRKTHVLIRGSFLNPGKEVEPDTPSIFPPFPSDAPRNRLGFARWLVSRDNPLTSRVAANRIWEALWGRGLVATSEDFGSQGEPPSHPELLDYLAVTFMDHGWSRKALIREIVTSAAYQQSSAVTPELRERDPYNVLLARGARFRLDAELLRDQALAAAGLLSRKVGGPSVMPHQPDGVWQVVYSSDRWVLSPGEDRYRRGIYTFWRRTSPHPAMVAFDAPSREVCTIRRVRTNTPLQALVTLNDPQFWEAAQGLAREVLRKADLTDPEQRLIYAFRRVRVRPPTFGELERLHRLLEETSTYIASRPESDVKKLATDPIGPLDQGLDLHEAATWSVVCNVLLNLDGVLTRD